MHFTRLRLNGFKSFVDPTELVIREGLTGVVGPNGCGKSNLLEALRWVMGENRPTAMRGSGMEDVVFAGTSSRGARAFAEVALSLDNADRLAPAGFNDSDFLEVSRRITRDAGSAYKVNGKDVRARDVQMLFADASTGAHSPALVRQGQISELINAKPKARRRILEEAAGISGLYQRRHEAELRLNATEANLERVGDTVDQMAQQLTVLARQARQAKRYREIAVELRRAEGMLLYRRWREASLARTEVQTALSAAVAQAVTAERLAREALAAREASEDALPPLREEEAIAGAILQRLQVQRDTLADQEARARDTVRTLMARIEQLRLDAQREAGLAADADESIERLQWEDEQLAQAGEGHEERLAEAVDAAREASDVLADIEAHLTEATEDVARLAARHQSLSRQASEAQAEGTRAASGAQRAADEAAQAAQALADAEEAQEESAEAREAAIELLEATEETLIETEAARGDAQAEEVETRAARAAAEGEVTALAAELGALDRLIARDRDASGAILDQIGVDPGYEHALGAALADDLNAPLAEGGSGWHALPAYETEAALPTGAASLAAHVRAPEALARRLAQVGVVAAGEAAALHAALSPGQRLVTREGDLWRWDGLMQRAEDAPNAAAIRLTQINRAEALREELDEAEARQDMAREAHEARQARLAELTEADRMARDARRAAEQRLSEANRAASRAEAQASLLQSKRETAALALERMQGEAEQAEERLAEAQDALAGLEDLDTARAGLESLRTQVEAARMAMMARRAAQEELRRDGSARRSRAQEVARDIQSWESRKSTAAQRIHDLESRAEAAAEELEEANAAPEEIQARREELGEAIAEAEARRNAAVEALLTAESALRAAQETERATERGAGEAREARARAEARVDAAGEAVTLAANRIADELDATPQGLLNQLEVAADAMPEVAQLDTDIARLKRARDGLGAVNLRAEEDARAIEEEHGLLVSERADLEAAIGKLRNGIAALNREGRERLLAAFDEVNSNFATLFTHLFGGGEARLVLVESDDPLEAGLEILCQPPGKKLSSLSLLSGGEQTLTALALIFAVFLANPAPICVLDEVDAPLDDANVMRFCDLLDEMTRRTETRFLIITHNALSMARMDRLFGVTMAEQGVSQLVSVDLQRAEALVA
ncbi:chromosome segregation protein SMC [Pararhodobacter oceanensis]|uniref:Chromosome partition protein Smc n=1 Tax=Pararhodobacter oceanensis TaxID=2172121 RepID=A0A2T8HSX2_9RHOB|nr:chromosome segregation protein SMC [Pararhodobacter oceanensis]PVH28539.1 chromosome segregation protein SMC [Pararhodobacter oceanensis]